MAQESLYRVFSEAGIPPRLSAKLDLLINSASSGEGWTARQVYEALLLWRARACRRSALEARQQLYDDLPRKSRKLTPGLFDASFPKPHGDGAERSVNHDATH